MKVPAHARAAICELVRFAEVCSHGNEAARAIGFIALRRAENIAKDPSICRPYSQADVDTFVKFMKEPRPI